MSAENEAAAGGAAAVFAATVGEALPWAKILLRYTDEVCTNVPAEHWELRPSAAAGGYWFSLGELVLHIADSRREIIANLSGDDPAPHMWQLKYGGTKEAWQWKPATRDEALTSLKEARELLEPWFALPVEQLGRPSAASVKEYEERLAKLKAEGKDTADHEKKGPQTVADCLMFLIGHEQSHRGVLQALLRLNGLEVTRYA